MNENKFWKFYDLVNSDGNGLLDRIRNLDYDIDDDEKEILEDIANYISENPAEPRLSAAFIELLLMMSGSEDENLTDFARHLGYLATNKYYEW